ncbi:Coenzyme PQQ synthesis protein B [Nitrospira sp. KM1]|uniref:pyrroloquinoline quinone biosynthesis protein PqqB n=1 Tax=Nitrospira sp. KM1 TaxID=1936990 RepID=UPI0013A71CB7|nr:pyrroloquinoline quinone biosynthesis protein PqqB [Nitrospira sp. KM1]BCA55253.1 Coenzyme PQQ synthesis protein B [Nitrospira sp. KM1]
MIVRVLGSAAGGGFPQWNCACLNCQGVRDGSVLAVARTQESLCIGTGTGDWFILNASPDIHAQIEGFPPLHPRQLRHSPVQAIFLTNGDLDHCLGLFSLRENHRLAVYATDTVWRGFMDDNLLCRTLQRFPGQLTWRNVKPGLEETVLCMDGRPSGLSVQAMAVPGKLPVHLEGLASSSDPEVNIGLKFRETASRRVLAYLPAVGSVQPSLMEWLHDADLILFDGTFWSEDELSASGILKKSAADMAHCPISGHHGSLAALQALKARRVFIHINNTNPILREDSSERRAVEAAGWEVAHDGMEMTV